MLFFMLSLLLTTLTGSRRLDPRRMHWWTSARQTDNESVETPRANASDIGAVPIGLHKKILVVRHGVSINNLLSQEKDLVAFVKAGGAFRDTDLAPKGISEAERVSQVLFGDEARCQDQYHLFDGQGGVTFRAVYVSPLKRATHTGILLFGPIARTKGIPFKVLAWAHEARHSISDVGSPPKELKNNAVTRINEVLQKTGQPATDEHTEPLASLLTTLDTLDEDWCVNPNKPDAQMPYYPPGHHNLMPAPETHSFTCRRIQRLEEELRRAPEDALILVAHSNMMRLLFSKFLQGSSPDNLAMIYGELTETGWENVDWFGEKEQLKGSPPERTTGIEGLPTVMPGKKARNNVRCSYQFGYHEIGTVGKYSMGSCCKNPRPRRWVYISNPRALAYVAPEKDVFQDVAKRTIPLQSTTQVWYSASRLTKLSWNDFAGATSNEVLHRQETRRGTQLWSQLRDHVFTSQSPATQELPKMSTRIIVEEDCASWLPAEPKAMQTVVLYTPGAVGATAPALFLVLFAVGSETNGMYLNKLAFFAACDPGDAQIDSWS